MASISLNTAAAITERSKRTWQRRLDDGTARRGEWDAGNRLMIELEDVLPLVTIAINRDDLVRVAAADAGDAEAQNDVAMLFLAAGRHKAAVYWLELAAEQGYADAMHHLGRCHLDGSGVPRDEHLALMWISKAAAHGHAIAREQLFALKQGALT